MPLKQPSGMSRNTLTNICRCTGSREGKHVGLTKLSRQEGKGQRKMTYNTSKNDL